MFLNRNILKINRKAFTMLELIFVIVIMGIMGKFGVEFLAQAYNSFIFSNINNTLQSQSGTAVEFISTRLQHRIKDSAIVRNTNINQASTADDIWNLLTQSEDENATVLEWVSADIDSFRGISDSVTGVPYLPNWTGIIDVDAGNANFITSPGTDTIEVNSLISILSDGNSTINDAAIYFIGSSSQANGWGYDGALITDQNASIHPINLVAGLPTRFGSSTTVPVNFSGVEVYEYYKLAWTANAVAHNFATGELRFYYDYQPWKGENYLDDGKSFVIMENVSSFRFRSVSSLIKVQICVKSNQTNEEYSICKEKTIF
ncbi:MAG: protein containing prepilin-type N- cleavage/methylation domain protein [Sulfurimonas sp.]|nr:MAG: protein containing prepilin-type N- cleavage/methylation domain protein [Sulfurimonas sp.]